MANCKKNKTKKYILTDSTIFNITKSIYNDEFNVHLKADKKKKFKTILYEIYRKFLLKNFQGKVENNKSKISISYIEGFDPQKKNDLFWFYSSKLQNSEILIYYENEAFKFKYDLPNSKLTADKFFRDKEISNINLKNFKSLYINHKIINTLNYINQFKSKNVYLDYAKQVLKEFLYRIEFWYSFFLHYNVKIDITNLEIGTEIIAKKIALDILDGCTVKKIRSYFSYNDPRGLIGWHNEDVVFAWGIDQVKKLRKTINYPNTTVLSGYYLNYDKNFKINFLENFSKKNKKNILMLDNAWSDNSFKDIKNGNIQLIYKEDYIDFKEKIINYVKNNSEVQLIIKPKKNIFINNIKYLRNIIDEIIKENKCYLIEDSIQLPVNKIINYTNMVISTSIFFPTILFEIIASNIKINTYHYDYSNISLDDKDINENLRNKVFFSSIEKLIQKLDQDLKTDKKNSIYWEKINKSIDPYNDNKGSDRLTFYIENLFKNLQINSKPDSLKKTNETFIKKYGEDKIFQ